MANPILLIDDEVKLRTLIARIIKLEGFDVEEVEDCKTAVNKVRTNTFDVILCDVKLPDGNGVDLVKELKNLAPNTEIILMTAYGNIPDGVQAIKNGAFDYITKGDDNNKIIPLLHQAIKKIELSKKVQALEKRLDEKYSFDKIIGHSTSLLSSIELARKVANSNTAVLLTGETGTGKEIFAQSIHQESSRSGHTFVALNCSAISRELLESELFGHKSGSFTNATKDKKGLFEEANKGTLFLDEIGEMPIDLQAKLLRVLETGEFIKIGETKTTKVDVRIITATNRDLRKEITEGHFREDLYYRISVFEIHLPALRERAEDIVELCHHFLNFFLAKSNKRILSVSNDAIDALKKHTWPGNIRELKNAIERAVILCSSNEIDLGVLPFEIANTQAATLPKDHLSIFELASAEKLHIQKVLNYTKGNKTKTAELLGIALTTLYRKLEEYRIS